MRILRAFVPLFGAISWLFVMKRDHWKWLPDNLSTTLHFSGVILCAKAQKQAACVDTAYGPVRSKILALSCDCPGLRMSRVLTVECSEGSDSWLGHFRIAGYRSGTWEFGICRAVNGRVGDDLPTNLRCLRQGTIQLPSRQKMEITKPKTLEDFPKFVVAVVRRGAATGDGYHLFELEGKIDSILEGHFDQIIGKDVVQWFWLLSGDRGCLCPTLKSFDRETKTAILTCQEKEEPVCGSELAYLSPYWQAFHVWMVLDPNWEWKKRLFLGTESVAQDYEAEEVSIVDGHEVKVWTKVEPVGEGSGKSRHYPAADQTLPVNLNTRLVLGAWDHEHCELCNEHIDTGMLGYCDPEERWMCEGCHVRYVSQRDLAFVDEL
jgi:hypothetical protein